MQGSEEGRFVWLTGDGGLGEGRPQQVFCYRAGGDSMGLGLERAGRAEDLQLASLPPWLESCC